MGKRREGREAAVQYLYQLDVNGDKTLGDSAAFWALHSGPGKAEVTAKTRTFAEQLAKGVMEHRDDIDALQILYSRPYDKRLTLKAIKELAAAIGRPPYNWTPERLWAAYEALEASRVRGSAGTQFTNLISLVRKALEPERDLVAYPLTVDERFQSWLAQQAQVGTTFTDEQTVWLTRIKDHLATSLAIAPDDFELEPFVGHGGYGRANSAFAGRLAPLLDELTQELVA